MSYRRFLEILIIFFLLFFLVSNTFCATNKTPNTKQQTSMNTRSVSEFGVLPQSNINETEQQKYQRWLKLQEAFSFAINNKTNLYFPKGTYDVGERNFPFREANLDTNKLLDCNGITIFGDGRGTVLKTSSKRGADVLQLNMIKNINIKNFDITADLYSQLESGSNGVSITNGYDNIVLDNLYIYNLPGISREGYIDGGKGLTMQFVANKPSIKGSLKASNIKVINCAYGFRFDAVNVSDLLKSKISLDIQIDVDKAYQGFSMDFGEASENVNIDSKLTVNTKATLKNCQQYVRFSRVIGGNYDFKLERTDNYNSVLRNKEGRIWTTFDTNVFAFLSNYSKSANIKISGDVGEVDNKILIGAVGSIVEPYNLKNRTEKSFFEFDISGKSKKEDVRIFNYKGESIHNSTINISKKTLNKGIIPKEFKANNNKLDIR